MSKPKRNGRPATAVTLMLVLGLLAGCNKFRSTSDLIHSAEAHRAKGEINAAIIDLKNALQKSPTDREVRLLLARYYLDLPDPRGAEALLLRVRQDGGSKKETSILMGEADLLLGKPDATLQESLLADEADAGLTAAERAHLLALRAEAYFTLGRNQEGKDAIAAARQQDPQSIEMLKASIANALRERDYPAVHAFLETAQKIAPDNTTIMLEQAAADYVTGEFAKSEAGFKRVRKLEHWNVNVAIGLARTLIAENKFKEADEQLGYALKASPENLNANYLQAVSALRQNDYKKTTIYITHVLDKSPGFAPALLVAGASAFGTHQFEQASVYLNQYIYQVPDDVHARQLLSSVEVAMGRPQDAVKTLAPVADKSSDAKLLSMIAAAAARSGDLTGANHYLTRAVEQEPTNAALRTQLGLTQVSLGNTTAGVLELEKASQQDQTSARPEAALVLTYIKEQQFDKAREVSKKVQRITPDKAIGFNLEGSVDLAQNNLSAAEANFLKALKLDPKNLIAQRSLAALAVRSNKLDDAAQYYRSLIKQNPLDTQSYIDLSNVQFRQNHPDQMQATLREAIDKNPDKDVVPRIILARDMMLNRQFQQAAEMVEPALAKEPKNPALLEVFGRSQLALGNNDAALRTFRVLADVAPDAGASHRYLAQAHAAVHDLDTALNDAKKAVALDPKNTQGRILLTQLYAGTRDYESAEKLANDLATENPKDPLLADLQGAAAAARGHWDASLVAYQRAVSINDNRTTRAALARAQMRAGHPKEAQKTLRDLINKDPKDTMPRLILGDIDLAQKDYDDAALQFSAILTEAPDNASVENNLAWALAQKGELTKALSHAQHAAQLAGSSAAVLDTLGVIQLQNKETADAVSSLEKAAKLAPQQSDIQFHYAQAVAASGDKGKARIILDTVLAGAQPFEGRDQALKLKQELGG